MRYFDCTKFDYNKFNIVETEALIERDKAAYKYSFQEWINSEIDNVVERKWEIENIGVVDETGDFIRLIKEAELTYSIGAYFSTIALVGVAGEDLCKYFAEKQGHQELTSQSQFERTKKLKELGVISASIHNKFDTIRKVRNNCLHFNDGFKSQKRDDLKVEAVNCINDLKSIYKELFSSLNGKYKLGYLTTSIIEDFGRQMANQTSFGDTLNAEEFTMKLRYFMASEFGKDIAIADSGSQVERVGLFSVVDIDLDEPMEIGLFDFSVGQHVIVDLTHEDISRLQDQNINVKSNVMASLTSTTNHQGVTADWYLKNIYRIS
ncbi:hypothetical protein [Enterovibrio norvegicus]|uniref:hypothetical protein n=1 Tax=Enterovibrio norvegicus TaxID=188144 RepID=UPI000C85A4AF|nr:hypothetical protein [Enterovibrio norvegicus]PMN74043.1 hypothetical protein BCT27_00250 [Enterovibrio norvegicus]